MNFYLKDELKNNIMKLNVKRNTISTEKHYIVSSEFYESNVSEYLERYADDFNALWQFIHSIKTLQSIDTWLNKFFFTCNPEATDSDVIVIVKEIFSLSNNANLALYYANKD